MPHQNAPYIVDEGPRKVAWCACGESEKQPYCDGSHARKNTGKQPIIVDVFNGDMAPISNCTAHVFLRVNQAAPVRKRSPPSTVSITSPHGRGSALGTPSATPGFQVCRTTT